MVEAVCALLLSAAEKRSVAAGFALPHASHHVFGLLAALAAEGAFVEVDEVRRGPRENKTHLLAASRTESRDG